MPAMIAQDAVYLIALGIVIDRDQDQDMPLAEFGPGLRHGIQITTQAQPEAREEPT